MRIAIGGFQHETNTFSPTPAGWQDFLAADTWPGLLQGPALLAEMTPAGGAQARNIPIAGFIGAARDEGAHTLLPLSWCAAGPSGRVTEDAFERIVALLLEGIALARADAVYLDLHGAMAAAHIDDADGEILRRVRLAIGDDIPLVASLDLHANVSPLMVDSADLLLVYRTYPHVDMAATGARAYAWLARRLQGMPRPRAAWRRIPFLIPICWQYTGAEPARSLRRLQEALDSDTLAAGLAMGFPATDADKCGPAAWAYAASADAARAATDRLAAAVEAAESGFAGDILDARDAVARAQALLRSPGATGPVIIADGQDNPGAGGSADTTGLLRALVAADARNAVIGLLVDAQAATQAHAAGAGAEVRLALGGKSGIAGDAPFEATFRVMRLHGGDVDATGSVFKGYRLTLGPSALLQIGGVQVIVVSRPVQLLDLALLRFVGLAPERLDIIAVKSVVHFRADFEPLARAVLLCASPGAFALDPSTLPWTKLPGDIRRKPASP
ncbi:MULTISPECIES: M81 family metallopeptidase [unclassified Herbaspirillum]|uniref:M81 family metallopeptidase n=1 Tax=unclassified Herbaspirillum TaxID=2624150 RepID=UPI0011520B4A|nr:MULTISPECIES: M81 family metallopeptidase [unclassified Herbaspirillum]MBB5391398.1 microcystin degradation protein MlrC [Herbaspirillum sp. SJZ102]TQK12917.1 microcystin degradation protein MlrC [Herbaspirillum sp. SJZ130]TQK14921.1 microcystin degradation protein MlrC [Herbaspirillum sp. SJZ106]